MIGNEKVNERLKRAKDRQDDEFYTQYSDIERELKYYESKFNGNAFRRERAGSFSKVYRRV